MSAFTLLFVGDVVGEAGVAALEKHLPELFQQHGVDFCVVNGENMHEGKGFNEAMCKRLYRAGADVLTGGDHSFDKHFIFPYMASTPALLRPLNYPKGAPGYGYGIYDVPALNTKIGVLNLRGQVYFQNPIRCPFQTADYALGEIQKQTNLIFIDFHAEATAEKIAMGWYVDGRASAIAGTHTHVQTGDEQILPGGTGYLTDVGFTGPHDSVIGMDKEAALRRFLVQLPQKYVLAEGNVRINAVVMQLDTDTGKTTSIQRLSVAAS